MQLSAEAFFRGKRSLIPTPSRLHAVYVAADWVCSVVASSISFESPYNSIAGTVLIVTTSTYSVLIYSLLKSV